MMAKDLEDDSKDQDHVLGGDLGRDSGLQGHFN